MTNAELFAKIKAEIERLKTVQLKRIQEGDLVDAEPYDKNEAYNELLDFIGTLEKSEKPTNPEDAMKELNEKIALVKQRGTWDGVDVDKYMDEVRGREPEKPVPKDLEEAADKFAVFYDQGTCDGIAQDCFIAGAKWQAEQLLKSSPLPEDTVLFNKGVEEGKRLAEEEQADLFTIVALDAAQRAKEQMMKEAVGVQVVGEQRDLRLIDSTQRCLFNAKRGDWLKIIIVKEDEK